MEKLRGITPCAKVDSSRRRGTFDRRGSQLDLASLDSRARGSFGVYFQLHVRSVELLLARRRSNEAIKGAGTLTSDFEAMEIHRHV